MTRNGPRSTYLNDGKPGRDGFGRAEALGDLAGHFVHGLVGPGGQRDSIRKPCGMSSSVFVRI
jgi:hypothetical protein